MRFTNDELRQMTREGWFIRSDDQIVPTSWATGEPPYRTQEEVFKFVKEKAESGSEFHRRVLAVLAARHLTKWRER